MGGSTHTPDPSDPVLFALLSDFTAASKAASDAGAAEVTSVVVDPVGSGSEAAGAPLQCGIVELRPRSGQGFALGSRQPVSGEQRRMYALDPRPLPTTLLVQGHSD